MFCVLIFPLVAIFLFLSLFLRLILILRDAKFALVHVFKLFQAVICFSMISPHNSNPHNKDGIRNVLINVLLLFPLILPAFLILWQQL